jgi:integrase
LNITEGVYEGKFDTPKTQGSMREIPLSPAAFKLLAEWRDQRKEKHPDSLVFSTRSGKPISPNNIVRRFVFPACEELGLPRATWLTFRRTYSSWAHDKGVPQKVLAQLMGHTNVNTTMNVYTQVMEDSLGAAVNKVGQELFSFVQSAEGERELIH